MCGVRWSRSRCWRIGPASSGRLDELVDRATKLGGEVVAVNQGLDDSPDLLNQDPYGNGWMIKFKPSDKSQWDELLTGDDYAVVADEEE